MDPGIEQGRITALIIVNSKWICWGRRSDRSAPNAVADPSAKTERETGEIAPMKTVLEMVFRTFSVLKRKTAPEGAVSL